MRINAVRLSQVKTIFKGSKNAEFSGMRNSQDDSSESFQHSKKHAQILCRALAITGVILAGIWLAFNKVKAKH